MKQNYNKQIKLLCDTCGSGDFFEKNEETGVITCKKCNGEEVDASFLPCDYVRHFEDGTDAEVTKISQAVA